MQEPGPTRDPGLSQEQEAGQPRDNSRSRQCPRRSVDQASTGAPSRSRSRPTLQQPPSQRGSSRDTTEMHGPTTPPEASSAATIKYTRTGRVSKASKGRRVHRCQECGKTYTRAEHLRRHQQNHQPGAYPCDISGCERSFYREDLLLRHKARHNDANDPPIRRQSVTSAPDAGVLLLTDHPESSRLPSTTISYTSAVAPELHADASEDDGQRTTESSSPPKRVPIPPNELSLGAMPLAVGAPLAQSYNLWHPASPSAPPSYDYESSDEHLGPYFQPQLSPARQVSDAGFAVYYQAQSASRSPVSTGSSIIYPHAFQPTGCRTPYNGTSLEFSPENSRNMVAIPYAAPRLLPAEARDLTELQDLLTAFQSLVVGDCVEGSLVSCEHLYLEGYWTWSHDQIPVIHRPSFHLPSASPLLRAAVLALGAQAIGGRDAVMSARDLHERSLKILKRRTVQGTHTFRICDMQAMLLLEHYSMFKSRRPPLQLSKSFELLYSHISNHPQALGLELNVPDAPILEDYTNLVLERSTKQRILLSCYALEQQHSLLFGRPSLGCLTIPPGNLPYPTTQGQWDEHLCDYGAAVPPFDRLYDAMRSISRIRRPDDAADDNFKNMIMLSCLCDARNDFEHTQTTRFDDNDKHVRALFSKGSPQTRITYHTFRLCRVAPVGALLAVAGESWIVAEDMGSQAEYTEAQAEVLQWVKDVPLPARQGVTMAIADLDVNQALEHAFDILTIHQEGQGRAVLFQEWAVYLAAITVGVYAHIAEGQGGRRSDGTRLDPARLSEDELEVAVSSVLESRNTGTLGWSECLCILAWTKKTLVEFDVATEW